MTYPVTIIVPIYNVSQYIAQCLVSLFEQDFDEIEYVFVNDCTPDDSLDILELVLERYPQRKEHVKVIHHQQNRGSGAARKTGIENATGEYTIQIDPDDWCELNMISRLYQKAKKEQADMVVCDFIMSYPTKEVRTNAECPPEQLMAMMLSGKTYCSVWNKLVKRKIYFENGVMPSEMISFAEDANLMIRVAFFCRKIVYIPEAFLHYRRGVIGSITKGFSSKNEDDFKYHVQSIIHFLNENKLYEEYVGDLFTGILSHKFYALCHGREKNYWDSFYPEVNRIKYISANSKPFLVKCLQLLTLLNFSLGRKVFILLNTIKHR